MKQVGHIIQLAEGTLSLDIAVSGKDGEPKQRPAELVPDKEENVVAEVERLSAIDMVRDMVNSLPDRERIIISSRFGVNGDPKVLREITKEVGLTEERIRQLQNKALTTLREMAKEAGLAMFL